MKIIYADTLVILNTVIDYLLLLSAGKLCALPLHRWRMGLGALWGGAYALLAAVHPAPFALWTVKLLAGAAAVVIAYGIERRTPRALAAFYAVAAAFGGAVHAGASLRGEPVGSGVSVSLPVLLLSFALCYAGVSLAFRHAGRRAERSLHTVTLSLDGREVSFSALADSGNELIDPVTGCSVLIVSAETLAPLFTAPELLLADAADGLEKLRESCPAASFRLLPCSCVAAEQTLLLCFRPEALTVDGRQRRDLLAAVSRNPMTADGEYQAIL